MLLDGQARGVVGFFDAKPLSTREVYEWQVASANFTSQDGTVRQNLERASTIPLFW